MVTTKRGDAPADGAAERTSVAANRPRDAVPVLLRAVRSMTRLTRPLAGRRFFPLWAVLHHRGRRSGRHYAVPVGVRATADVYFIALPFGERTQWVHNVVAAGGCTVRWRGEDLVMAEPTLVGSDQAAPAFPPALRWMLRVAGVHLFMRLRPAGRCGRLMQTSRGKGEMQTWSLVRRRGAAPATGSQLVGSSGSAG